MANVTYDDRSFLIDGQRVWLASGSIHYFRVPSPLWRDRLLKARRAGLNCISTYVPWNFHEPQEGKWNFSGDCDVAEFVRIADDLGLYVILRPGPFIGADWDFGGLPGWLTTKTGIAYRTSNAAFTHYFDKYFRQVLSRLADLQVSRGGNIIAVQNENEYRYTTMPDRMNYLEFISQLFRRAGFEAPILTCNYLTEPMLPDAIECANVDAAPIAELARLRAAQPDKPLLVTEFRGGPADRWGGEHHTQDARAAARMAMEMLGCGAMYNHYMWHGGTNFAFHGGGLPNGQAAWATTSHDRDAPLAEGGELTEKYALTRLVNLSAVHLGRFLATMRAGSPPAASLVGGPNILTLSGAMGGVVVVSNGGDDAMRTAEVALANGTRLTLSLEAFGAAMAPVDLELDVGVRLDWANMTPLGVFGGHTIVFYAPAGWPGRVCVNGKVAQADVPAGDEPLVIEQEGLRLVLVRTELARRTWPMEEGLVFGPEFVGEELDDLVPAPRAKQFAILPPEGKLTHKKIKTEPASHSAPPRLGQWKRVSVCTEPSADGLEWTKLDRPRDVDQLGVPQGYVWCRAVVPEPRACKRHLLLPDCEDRAIVYVNGEYVGTWGRGDGATRKPLPAAMKRGENAIVLLTDNLGRVCGGSRLGERKGLFGPIYDAKPLRTRKFKVRPFEDFSKRMVPRALQHLADELQSMPVHAAELSLPLTKVTPIHLSFTDLPNHAAVYVNERSVGFYPAQSGNYADITLGPELRKGKNTVRLLLWGEVDAKALDRVRFHALDAEVTHKARWSWRKWQMPREGGPVVGKDQPAWYACRFKRPADAESLYLHILSARKGQIFLNGHNVGRFWTVGPQFRYYLPACWMQEENELLIFEESGAIPSKSRLERCVHGPYGD